ncbi:hypothetical protein CCS92_29995 [Methylobacterium radiotolerans]|nr:hypothetical protein CCS92_29995 [Methylobacterium radiotolerans]
MLVFYFEYRLQEISGFLVPSRLDIDVGSVQSFIDGHLGHLIAPKLEIAGGLCKRAKAPWRSLARHRDSDLRYGPPHLS